MSSLTPRAWILLTVTHVLVATVGVYWGAKQASRRRDLILEYTAAYARFPRRDAAELAFRFGTTQDAKILVADQPNSADFEVVRSELRLAALFGEHLTQSMHGPHLLAAAAICERAGKCPCSLDRLRQQAANLAKSRNN